MAGRIGVVKRDTSETGVSVEVELEGRGTFDISTGMRMLDHLVSQIARHGLFDLKLYATGSDKHHVVEDVAICLGQAVNRALGDKKGLVRTGHAVVPMDDALALVAVDFGGRPYAEVEVLFGGKDIGDLPASLVKHFFVSLASEARMNLHVHLLRGEDDHHKAEAMFKALARALDMATRTDDRLSGRIPSTKDVIER
jgi:imidazoleglycerol-phosphate dehydratase